MTPESMRAEGELVLARICSEAALFGVTLTGLVWSAGRFDRQRDPASGEDALIVVWKLDGRRVQLTLRPDGNIFAECDLLIDHPQKPKFWMDTLTVWGTASALKAEPNLIEKPV